ncbi:CRISPR-associated protein Cas1 [Methanoregula boonei 6A8]|uniref:CRISPR-associated endonuclease Cas1 n=1 Tax=Methanoregula boonei (strain DSM 21154 / JCM 14090 / 6A8) TaxID=456442 RepID=A7I668_METB6|nr:CRISPR-associated endonuclease Cas1 [Methanoregula boonei]ABS55229.1 CRISPR-associated protein Cas1 [Methanoregula boonei 6A8]
MTRAIPWVAVYGFGAHIKSTQKKLSILAKGKVEEYPLEEIQNLLIVGGHHLNSTTFSHLLRNGSYISFFEPDGSPLGILKPWGSTCDTTIRALQEGAPRDRYATALAQAALKSRLIAIEHIQDQQGSSLFYEGELQILHNALHNLEYMVKLDEIRRLSDLTANMYYEILSRDIPREFDFRRRTVRPQCDPINAMLSFGYAMLFGNCCVPVIGARLDPDLGILYEGSGALVQDLMASFKAQMIDGVIWSIARDSLNVGDFEITSNRCILSDNLIQNLMSSFRKSIDNQKLDCQVHNFLQALSNKEDLTILY